MVDIDIVEAYTGIGTTVMIRQRGLILPYGTGVYSQCLAA